MENVFSMDAHLNLLVTTIRTEGGEEIRKTEVSVEELKELMDWMKEKGYLKKAKESSEIYWVSIYTALTDGSFSLL